MAAIDIHKWVHTLGIYFIPRFCPQNAAPGAADRPPRPRPVRPYTEIWLRALTPLCMNLLYNSIASHASYIERNVSLLNWKLSLMVMKKNECWKPEMVWNLQKNWKGMACFISVISNRCLNFRAGIGKCFHCRQIDKIQKPTSTTVDKARHAKTMLFGDHHNFWVHRKFLRFCQKRHFSMLIHQPTKTDHEPVIIQTSPKKMTHQAPKSCKI